MNIQHLDFSFLLIGLVFVGVGVTSIVTRRINVKTSKFGRSHVVSGRPAIYAGIISTILGAAIVVFSLRQGHAVCGEQQQQRRPQQH